MKGYLVLEDGTVITGETRSEFNDAYGEVVFTTSMTGYMESITDPSYRGQILVFASPTIGNYPMDLGRMESERVQVAGIISRDIHAILPSREMREEFYSYLSDKRIPFLDGIDTRSLVRRIREHGVMKGWITGTVREDLEWPEPMDRNLVGEVSPKKAFALNSGKEHDILFIDVGTKKSLLEDIEHIGNLKVVPYDHDFSSEVGKYDAIFVSNGPGDPDHVSLENTRNFLRESYGKTPIYGVCLGHQILALALGGKTFKMPFGHRGSNHAVTDGTHVWITSHNHGFAVDSNSLKKTDLRVTQWDINDRTPEMMETGNGMAVSIQYHPEASPGPHDARWFFTRIKKDLEVHHAKR
jgi:carbamoyl-phosphate synthase small subunit